MRIKTLIIDDDEDDFFITSQYLKEISEFNIESSWSYNIIDAQAKLKSNEFDLYLVDYRLGARTGLDLLKEAVAGGCSKPIILLTGKGNTEIDKRAVEAGAYDYLVKSELNADKLERCIRYANERYKSFKIIKDNEKKYRLIFENAISFIFTCDPSMKILECNNASEYFTEYKPQELKNTSFLNLIDPADLEAVNKRINQKRNISDLKINFQTKSDRSKLGSLNLNYFESPESGAYWQGIIYDESIRTQAEQAKMHSEKVEATYRLISTLAHEIRNPLTNIGLSVGGMIDEGINESQKTYADIIQRSSTRINDIITELLNSSKAIELKFELLDLNDLLREVVQIAHDSSQLNKVEVRVNYWDYPIVKPIDKDKFKIALLNLIFNAIEASDKENGLLKISIEQNLENTVIVLEDNGSGIKDEDLKKLFEPYFTTKKTGVGLGLVATLNIIKSHKAKIDVQSKVGVGTTFKIIFE